MPHLVDFVTVSTAGRESSPHARRSRGLLVNVVYAVEPGGKRAVGVTLADGTGGSYFVVKGEY